MLRGLPLFICPGGKAGFHAPHALQCGLVTRPEDWTGTVSGTLLPGRKVRSKLKLIGQRVVVSGLRVSGTPPPRCQLKAPPSRKQREKGRNTRFGI
jgi:hypothetical protein